MLLILRLGPSLLESSYFSRVFEAGIFSSRGEIRLFFRKYITEPGKFLLRSRNYK